MKKGWALLGLMLLAACGGSADFKAGSYKLVDSLNNVPTTLTFDANGHVNGKVVNYLMGSYKLSAKNNIKFGDMATTMMMGPADEMEAESDFLQILPRVKSYKMDGENLILVTDNGGELVFEPYTPTEEE